MKIVQVNENKKIIKVQAAFGKVQKQPVFGFGMIWVEPIEKNQAHGADWIIAHRSMFCLF